MRTGISRPHFHVSARRSSEDPRVVIAEVVKSWFVYGVPGGQRKVLATVAITVGEDPEAVLLADVLSELARDVRGELYRL